MTKNNYEADSRGLNVAITSNILPEEQMRKLGFTDHLESVWYYSKYVSKNKQITFNVSIPKDGSRFEIDILDENFLQPYDYQAILSSNPNNHYAKQIKKTVEDHMQQLFNYGIIAGWKPGMYI